VTCTAVGMLMHPLMAIVGAVFLAVTFLIPRHPRLTLGAAAVGFLATLGIVIALAPLGRVTGVQWWYTIHWTSSNLFITYWSASDWGRAASHLAVLVIGCQVGAAPLLRRICAGLLGTVAAGMLVTLVFCDLLHVSLFIDLQAWRWLWLAEVLSIALVPAITRDCWQRGYSGRIAVVMLAATWLLRDLPVDILTAMAASGFAVVPREWSHGRPWRLGFVSACALLGLIICLNLGVRFAPGAPLWANNSSLLQEIRAVCTDGVIPATVLIALWSALRAAASDGTRTPLSAAIAVAAAVACVALWPAAWQNFNTALYTPDSANRFTQWRAAIPPRAEVFWPDNPVGTWYFLDRPSYLSDQQLAGAIFSRDKALLAQRRMTAVAAARRPDPTHPRASNSDIDAKTRLPVSAYRLDLTGMRAICADPDLQYIVSPTSVAPTAFTPVTVDSPSRTSTTVYLYRCAALRS
jgi:hypothetical protein